MNSPPSARRGYAIRKAANFSDSRRDIAEWRVHLAPLDYAFDLTGTADSLYQRAPVQAPTLPTYLLGGATPVVGRMSDAAGRFRAGTRDTKAFCGH